MDRRRAAVAVLTPVNAGLPRARTALRVRRDWSEKRIRRRRRKTTPAIFYAASRRPNAPRAVPAVRTPWSVENRNHHQRDASAWQEDRHRHRQPNAALNLALTRNVLLALIPCESGQPLAHYFERNGVRRGLLQSGIE